MPAQRVAFRPTGKRVQGPPPNPSHDMIHQLRIYEIHDATRDAFLHRFAEHATRIMRRHGFTLVGTWETGAAGGREFVYLLAWPDAAAMHGAWTSFLADPEWIEIKRVTQAAHGRLVGRIEDRVLVAAGAAGALPGM